MPKEICVIFGEKLRAVRISAGYSQEKLAELSGLDRTYIGGIERGERNPTLKNIARLCLALNIKIKDLFNEI